MAKVNVELTEKWNNPDVIAFYIAQETAVEKKRGVSGLQTFTSSFCL